MPDQLERYHKIMDLYWFINGLKKGQLKANNRPTIFVECMGHVGCVEVEIFPQGWSMDAEDDEYIRSEHNLHRLVYENHDRYSLDSTTSPKVWDECIAKLETILRRCRDESDQSIQTEA